MDRGGVFLGFAEGFRHDRDPSFAERYGGQAGHATVGELLRKTRCVGGVPF